MNPFVNLFRSLARQVAQRRRVAFCTVVGAHGSTPQAAGASLLLHENMTTEGTLGGGCVEAEVRKQAFQLLQRSESGLLSFKLDHDYGWDDGLICGGTMRVAVMSVLNADDAKPFQDAAADIEYGRPACIPIRVPQDASTCGTGLQPVIRGNAGDSAALPPQEERSAGVSPVHVLEYRLHIEAPAKLLIAGAGHVGAELARLAAHLDFDVTIIDDRTDLTTPDRLPPPIRPLVGDIERTLRGQKIDASTFVVIVTRGHNHDEQALHAVIDSPARYIGMIGSRRKVKLIFDDLAALGVAPEKLQRVHAPIGLSIGAVTVPEIAVSILAQLIEVRRSEKPTRVEGPFPVEAVLPSDTAPLAGRASQTTAHHPDEARS